MLQDSGVTLPYGGVGELRRTRHLSKHISQPTNSFPVKLDPWQEGGVFHEEVIPHSIGWRWNKNTQILQSTVRIQ